MESDTEKTESTYRIARIKESKELIEAAVTQGREMERKIGDRIESAQKRHANAMRSLLVEIDKLAGKAGKK